MRTEEPASTAHPRTTVATAEGRHGTRHESRHDQGASRQSSELAETEDAAPEEAGYGYGV